MQKSQLFQIISQLSAVEQRSLQKFVRSPYHNSRKELIQLCDLLIKSANSKDKTADTKAYYYKKLYPEAPYDDKKMRYSISFLYKLVKYFLAVEQLGNDKLRQQQMVALAFKEKKLNRFEKEVLRSEQILENQSLRDAQYYYDRYQNLSGYNSSLVHRSKAAATLEKMNSSADIHSIATTLKLGCMWLTLKTATHSDHSNKLLQHVLQFITENKAILEVPVIGIYYNVYQMLCQTDQDQFFDSFKSTLGESGHLFQQKELSELYVYAVNHCIKQANLGNKLYLKELFELYKTGLEAGVFLNNGEMNSVTYINIAQSGLTQKAYDWVLDFIETNKANLKSSVRNEYYLFNLANFYNRKGNFDQVMEILRTITFDEIMLELAARRMLLKIYYELNEVDALYSFFDSFKNYIYRHKEVGYGKANYLNLIKYAKKLTNINGRDQKAIDRLIEEIKGTQAVAEKGWLLERLELLKG